MLSRTQRSFTCSRVGIAGAGTMGTAIAMTFADAGMAVVVTDTSAASLERMRSEIARRYRAAAEKGRLSETEAAERTRRITTTESLSAFAEVDLALEAVFEDLSLKRALFQEFGRVCSPDAILATNTSTLDVDAITAVAPRPERSLGLHFFSPAHVMKLIEIVRGARTSPHTIEQARSLAERLGKKGVVVGNCDGFVGNRMLARYRHEAETLLEEGASPRQVDAALTGFGFAMGPFAVSDLAGLDISYQARRERAARGVHPPFRQSRIPDALVESGRLGQKSGAGYYRYEPGSRAPLDDPIVEELIASERARLRMPPRAIEDREIVDRCLAALAEEGEGILRERAAESAADVDTIWVRGYGFPAARGGPMSYAATLGKP